MYTRQYMVSQRKLYWRIKKEGRWTWIAAESFVRNVDGKMGRFIPFNGQEEE